MTQEEIIRMAREAGLLFAPETGAEWSAPIPGADYPLRLAAFAALIAAAEREACAKIVEQYCGAWDDAGYALSQAVRARGQE